MTSYEKFFKLIEENEVIRRYRAIEEKINENKALKQLINQTKQVQKQMVNAESLEKKEAYKAFKMDYEKLLEKVKKYPLMEEYLELQADINQMVQDVLSIIENGINIDLSSE